MDFFDVKDGEGGTVEDRIAIVVVSCFAVSWIPIMVVWKCVSVARRRSSDVEQGNVPVTTHASDPEKHPLPPQMVPSGRFNSLPAPYDDDDGDDSGRDRLYRPSEAEGPRRPEPLAGGRRHKRHGESAGRHSNSANRERSKLKHAKEEPHKPYRYRHQRGRRSEYEHYPDEPLRVDERLASHETL